MDLNAFHDSIFNTFLILYKVIFTTHTLSFFVFLGLFGYILLFDYNYRPTSLEWFLLFWVFTYICDEVRQIAEG